MNTKLNSKLLIKKGLIVVFILLLCQAFWIAFITPSPELKTHYEHSDFYSENNEHYLKAWPENIAPKLNKERETYIDELLASLTLEEKIAQMILLPESIPETDYEIFAFSGLVFDQGSNSRDGKKLKDWHKKLDGWWELQKYSATQNNRPFIPPFLKLDVQAGNGMTLYQTIFPTRINLGQTQNPNLVESIAAAQAEQAAYIGFNWIVEGYDSPIHDKRIAQIGQSFSEDPALIKHLSASYVKGAQSTNKKNHTNIMTSSRGYLAFGSASFTRANIFEDESILLNRYAPGHIAAIKEGVLSVEVSNGQINSLNMINSQYYIQDILKNKMGFNGIVVSPINATAQIPGCRLASCVSAINAGVDVFYFDSNVSIKSGPASFAQKTYKAGEKFISATKQAVKSGDIKIERINDAARRVLRVKHQLGLFDFIKPSERVKNITIDQNNIEALAKQAVKESAVILKNSHNTLPLSKKNKVLLTGLGADDLSIQIGYWANSSISNNRSIKRGQTLNDSFKNNDLSASYDFIEFDLVDSLGVTQKALEQHLKRVDNTMIPKKDKIGINGELDELNSEDQEKLLAYQLDYEKEIKKITRHYKQIVMVISQAPVRNGTQREAHLNYAQYYQNQIHTFQLLESLDSTITVIFYGHAPMYMPEIMDKANAFIFAGHIGSDASGLIDVLFNKDMQNFGKLAFSWPRQPCDFKQSLGVFEYDPFLKLGAGLNAYDANNAWYSAVPEDVEFCNAIKR